MIIEPGLLIHELTHFMISLIVGVLLYLRYHDRRLIFISLFVGVFVDLDHWLDYFLFYGPQINLDNFFHVGRYVHASGKVYVLLHGWEVVPLFWFIGHFLAKKYKLAGLEWSLSLALLGHLTFDNSAFTHNPLAYSIIYRILRNFSLASFDSL